MHKVKQASLSWCCFELLFIVTFSNENPEIGEYIKHCIDDDFNLLVLLKNNGKINMSLELAKDFEKDAVNINQFRIIQVANSFQKIK